MSAWASSAKLLSQERFSDFLALIHIVFDLIDTVSHMQITNIFKAFQLSFVALLYLWLLV